MPSPLNVDDASSVEEVNAWLNARRHRFDGGYFRCYYGTPRAGPRLPLIEQRLVVELRFETPAFGPAIDGWIRTLGPLVSGIAKAYGQLDWTAVCEADGVTPILDISMSPSAPGVTWEYEYECRCHREHPHPLDVPPTLEVGKVLEMDSLAFGRPGPAGVRWAV